MIQTKKEREDIIIKVKVYQIIKIMIWTQKDRETTDQEKEKAQNLKYILENTNRRR